MKHANWWEEIYESLQRACNQEELFTRVRAASEDLGFTHCCYGLRHSDTNTEQQVTIMDAYPTGWMEHYRSAGYINVDPTVSLAARGALLMVWSDRLFSRAGRLWKDARDTGLRVGLAQPCWSAGGTYGLLSLARDSQPLSESELQWLRPRLRWLTDNTHERMRLLCCDHSTEDVPELSLRERQVLSWTAEGKTSWEVSRILKISENTVNFHIKRIIAKLGAQNKSHAAARAATLGLLEHFGA